MSGVMVKRETDYAIRTVLYLTMLPANSRTTAGELAAMRLIPRAMARRIVTKLTAAGILRSGRGLNGGITLARPPAEITILEVMRAVGGTPVVSPCAVNPESCPLMAECPVHQVWVNLQNSIEATLGRITFAQLVHNGQMLKLNQRLSPDVQEVPMRKTA